MYWPKSVTDVLTGPTHLSLLTSHFSPLTSHLSPPGGQSQLLSAALHSLEDDLNVLFQRNA